MQAFENLTNDQNEKAVKIGKNVPADAVALSWFTNKSVIPEDSIHYVDLSDTIPENSNKKIDNETSEKIFLAYADELGVLRTEDGNYSIPNSDILVSNILLNKPLQSKTYLPSEINPEDFAYYYYISRFFIEADNSFSFLSLNDFISDSILNNLGIKVIDKNGREYIDDNESRKKYRILLEPYKTNENVNSEKIPHRIIVLLDSSKPSNLKLVYNKCESNEYGSTFNVINNYSEIINATEIFKVNPEEAFVIDHNYSFNRNFSIKKINEKYSEITNKPIVQEGYQAVVPSKAIADHRTYEMFNWRLVAKTKKNFNYEQSNYGYELSGNGTQIQATVNVAILYSSINSESASTINPYVFQRLEESPFNLSKYIFKNPKSITQDKNSSEYWTVDIDSVNNLDDYDAVIWSPTFALNHNQSFLLLDYLNKNGTILLDLSCPTANATALNPDMAINRSGISSATHLLNQSNKLIDENKNGGWDISDDIFEQDYYNIFGSKKAVRSNVYKSYHYFSNVNSDNSIITIGSSNPKTIGQIISYNNNADALSCGNLIATTFPIMSYCNSIYQLNSPELVLDANYSETTTYKQSSNTYSAVVEGPFKLLYNTISYALHCRTHATKSSLSIDLRSSLYNFVSDWNSSYVINQDVLTEEEKNTEYIRVPKNGNTYVYGKNLIITKDDQYVSIFEFYKSALSKFLPAIQRDRLFTINSADVDFYIEVTNEDVQIVNAEPVDLTDDVQNKSAYYVHKMTSANSSPFAYTEKKSPNFSIPSQVCAHALIQKNISLSNNKILTDNFNALSSFKEYPFSLSCLYNYFRSSEKHSIFDADVDLKSIGYFDARVRIKRMPRIYRGPTPAKEAVWANNISYLCINTKSAIDDMGLLRATDSASANNIFPYTGDIDIHNDKRIFKIGDNHSYIKYIQWTLAAYGCYTATSDGVYGAKTKEAVLKFQTDLNQRYKDGKVDSETKWHLSRYWKQEIPTDINRLEAYKSWATEEIKVYIDAAINTKKASDINQNDAIYKKITFTGFEGPTTGEDVIYFEIPSQIEKINKITIKPDMLPAWRNYSIKYYGFSSQPIQDLPNGILSQEAHLTPLNLSASNSDIEIIFPEKNYEEIRYMFIVISAGKSPSYGAYAETFSIKSIVATGRTMISPEEPAYPGDPIPEPDPITTIRVKADIVTESLFVRNISVVNDEIVSYSISRIPKNISYITNISTYDSSENILQTYSFGKNIYLNQTSEIIIDTGQQNDPDIFAVEIIFDPQNIAFINPMVNQTIINKVYAANTSSLVWETPTEAYKCPISVSEIQLANNETAAKFVTSSIYYDNNESITSLSNITTYRLKNINGFIFPGQPNSVTVNDGIVLICDDNGAPTGMPNLSEVKTLVTSNGDEAYLQYGLLAIKNSLDENGLIYGFYDINQRKFLGKTISYTDYIMYGVGNVYIALCAIDADGVTQNKNEYLGISTTTKFKPVNVPIKYAAPIYSVKVQNSPSIRVEKPSNQLGKFDIWDLPIKMGSFFKNIIIPNDTVSIYSWTPELSNQSLLCKYSTLNLECSYWSKIYGYGFYDVKDEVPIYIDSKTIKLKNFPIAIFNFETNYRKSLMGILKPIVKIYTRQSTDDPWELLDVSEIKDIDCENGIIYFYNSIVPIINKNYLIDSSLIKVEYSYKSSYAKVKQINGNLIPLNPFLNEQKGASSLNKPLYIYLKPVEIYRHSIVDGNSVAYEKVANYSQTTPIDYTYESGLFNVNSELYNPFLIPLGIFYNNLDKDDIEPIITDIRSRGGGLSNKFKTLAVMQDVDENILSYWDVYAPSQQTYPKGGYVIIRLPKEVKNNFVDEKEVYEIVSNNLTAGVAFDIEDLDGNTWS